MTVTDDNGCQQDITVEITETEELIVTETHSNNTGFGVTHVMVNVMGQLILL